ncbi:L-serine ammonia-lyase, partial [Devosia sp.]|uniref:L-serine ammonia-lyase n=1 Tax=Devosia sp. TaxID=1871048 RepID=UPI002F2555BB
MFLSVFDIFKVSVGPSSSHTMGPMIAANRFIDAARAAPLDPSGPLAVRCHLYGSLAYTGEGHGTFRAVLVGLLGFSPENYDRGVADRELAELGEHHRLDIGRGRVLTLDPVATVVPERGKRLPAHPNAMTFRLVDAGDATVFEQTYYSVGGGFVVSEDEMQAGAAARPAGEEVPFPFSTAAQMLQMGKESGLSIAQMKRANELARRSAPDLAQGLARVWEVMDRCIDRGLEGEGILPGGLNVPRRARGMREQLEARHGANTAPLHSAVDWLSAYAMAVNEENAAGGQVVTAPTNGAAGVIPAVIRYYLDLVPGASREHVPDMLLTAAAVGGLIKYNASISGAEVGC